MYLRSSALVTMNASDSILSSSGLASLMDITARSRMVHIVALIRNSFPGIRLRSQFSFQRRNSDAEIRAAGRRCLKCLVGLFRYRTPVEEPRSFAHLRKSRCNSSRETPINSRQFLSGEANAVQNLIQRIVDREALITGIISVIKVGPSRKYGAESL